ncbi:MAG: L-2-amino-thiazoline-4-carboxylic acid hydrolase [Candidatus Thorarchaeota archaeon]
MTKENTHKFQSKYDSTYADFLKDVYAGRIALIREFETHVGKEEALRIVKNFYETQAVENIKDLVAKLDTPIESIETFGDVMKRLASNEVTANTQTMEYANSPPGTFHMCTTECLWADVFKELDAADLGYIMLCGTDFPAASAFHENIRLERTKTLMQGDDHCDFIYHWDETD